MVFYDEVFVAIHVVIVLSNPVGLRFTSEESNPIQVADLIAGVVSQKILQSEDPHSPFHRLFFDARKLQRMVQREST